MKFDKFTLKAQEALATAQQIAMAKSHTVLSPLHLLSAVCDDAGVAVMIKKVWGNYFPAALIYRTRTKTTAAGRKQRPGLA